MISSCSDPILKGGPMPRLNTTGRPPRPARSTAPQPIPDPAPLATAPRCGARTRAGTPCRGPRVRGKRRCRMHGGADGSGAVPGNRNAWRHGEYSGAERARRRRLRNLIRSCEITLVALGWRPRFNGILLPRFPDAWARSPDFANADTDIHSPSAPAGDSKDTSPPDRPPCGPSPRPVLCDRKAKTPGERP